MTWPEIILIYGVGIQFLFILCLIRSNYDLSNHTTSAWRSRDEAWDSAHYWRNQLISLIQHLRRGGSIAIIGCFGADTHALIKRHEEELGIRHD